MIADALEAVTNSLLDNKKAVLRLTYEIFIRIIRKTTVFVVQRTLFISKRSSLCPTKLALFQKDEIHPMNRI